MTLVKEIAFASTLTIASLLSIAQGQAHEIKFKDLVIDHPWTRQSPMAADVMAGFMTITNTGKEDDRLVKATVAIAPTVQLHDMKMEGDVMKMFEVPGGIVIPAGASVELKPRHLHIMFIGVTRAPMEGEEIKGTLTFEKAGTVDIEYAVEGPGAGMN